MRIRHSVLVQARSPRNAICHYHEKVLITYNFLEGGSLVGMLKTVGQPVYQLMFRRREKLISGDVQALSIQAGLPPPTVLAKVRERVGGWIRVGP